MTKHDRPAHLSKSQELLLYLFQLKNGYIEDKTALAKLQYLSDFIHYAFHSNSISGDSNLYTRQKQGPLSRNLTKDIEDLKSKGLLIEDKKYHYRTNETLPELSLSEAEKKTIRFVIFKYGNLKWDELVAISHNQDPYLSASETGVVEFQTAFNLVDEYPDYESFS